MIPRICSVEAKRDYKLLVQFDDGARVLYDVADDINTLKAFLPLKTEQGLFPLVKLDESRTCVYWDDRIDLPSDTLREYGERLP